MSEKEEAGNAKWKINMLALECPPYPKGGSRRREGFIFNVLERPCMMIAHFVVTETILCTENNTQFKNVRVSAETVTGCVIWGTNLLFQSDLRCGFSISSALRY